MVKKRQKQKKTKKAESGLSLAPKEALDTIKLQIAFMRGRKNDSKSTKEKSADNKCESEIQDENREDIEHTYNEYDVHIEQSIKSDENENDTGEDDENRKDTEYTYIDDDGEITQERIKSEDSENELREDDENKNYTEYSYNDYDGITKECIQSENSETEFGEENKKKDTKYTYNDYDDISLESINDYDEILQESIKSKDSENETGEDNEKGKYTEYTYNDYNVNTQESSISEDNEIKVEDSGNCIESEDEGHPNAEHAMKARNNYETGEELEQNSSKESGEKCERNEKLNISEDETEVTESTDVPKSIRFMLDQSKWKEIKVEKIKRGLKLSRNWMRVFYEAISLKFAACPLVCTYNHVRREDSGKDNMPFFHGKAECSVKDCGVKFKFEIQELLRDAPVEVTATSIGQTTINHPENTRKSRPFQGEIRDKAKRSIKEMGPSNFFYEQLGDADEQALSHGNYTGVSNKSVIKKIASEIVHDEILHQSMTTELELLRDAFVSEDTTSKEVKGLIQFLSITPFSVHLYSEEQLLILCELLRTGRSDSCLFFDATGSVVCQIPDQKKSVYYYPLLIEGRKPGDPPIPVGEMITNSHTIPDIVNFLMRLFRHCKSLRPNCPPPQKVEIDWSWPFIHAVLLVFNKESIPAYLARTATIVEGRSRKDQRHKTVIHVCSAHFLHLISMHLNRICTQKKVRSFLLYCTAILIDCSTLESFRVAFRAILVVLTSSTTSSHQNYQESLQFIRDRINNRNIQVELNTNAGTEMEGKEIYEEENIHQSYFAVLGQSIYNQVRSEIRNTTAENNSLQCTPAIKLLLRYVAYLPFWSGILLGDLDRHDNISEGAMSSMHDTNSVAENWMRTVKKNILLGRKRLRPAEFIVRLNINRKGRLREFKMAMNSETSPTTQKKARKRKLQSNSEQLEEIWKENRGKKGKYFGKRKKDDLSEKGNNDKNKNVKSKQKRANNEKRSNENIEEHKEKGEKNDILKNASSKTDDKRKKDVGKGKEENDTRKKKTSTKAHAKGSKSFNEGNAEKNITMDRSSVKHNDKRKKQKGDKLKFTNTGLRAPSTHGNVLHWGGTLTINGRKVVLSNTCPLDNLLYMTFLILTMSRSCLEWFQSNAARIPVCQVLLDVHGYFQRGQWQQGRRRWLEDCCQFSLESLDWDVWGGEVDRFVMPFSEIQETISKSTCTNPGCSNLHSTWLTREIILGGEIRESEDPTDFNAAVKRWETLEPIACNSTKGKSSEKCQGRRTWRRRRFINPNPPILIVSASYLSQRHGLKGMHLPEEVNVLGKWYDLFGFTINRHEHFKGFFKTGNAWSSYDDTRSPEVVRTTESAVDVQTNIEHVVLCRKV